MIKMTLGTLAALAAGSALAFDFVKDGKLQVTFEGAERPPMQLAVKEFNRIVGKVTGCETHPGTTAGCETHPGTTAGCETHPGTYLGASRTEKATAGNRIAFAIDPDLGPRDTYEIRVEGWSDPKTGAKGERLWLVGNNARSCWFAMCDILEQLGCRWFWDGEDGEYLPAPTKTLALADPATKTTAAFAWREMSAHPNIEREMWWAHNRINPIGRGKVNWGQSTSWGGHSFNWICPLDCKGPVEYFKKYPEQWALMDGVRVDGNHCYTNPDTIKTFSDWILRFWESHPDTEFLTLTARDCPVYCRCENCAKLGDSSTLFFNFLNKITAAAIKKYPKKRYQTIAYAFYSAVPKVKLNDHFDLKYCMYDRCYKHKFGSDCPVNPTAKKAMQAWKDRLGFPPNVYGYHFDMFGGGWPMYMPLATIFQDEIKWCRDFGMRAWMTEFYGGYADKKKPRDEWGMIIRRWPGWAVSKLLWNPDLDLAALRKDFCDHVYGAAGAEIDEYFRTLDAAWEGEGHLAYYNNCPASISDGFVRNPELVKKIDALFAAAEKKVAGDARAAKEVAADKAMWGRWRELATGPSMAARWTMKVPYAKVAPNMDGTGTDKAWDAGATEKEFVHAKRPCKKDPTWATVLRTDDALYLRVIGWGDTKEIKQTKTKRDDDVYMDDGIELCLDPMNTRTDYYWICVNTLANTEDALASLGMNINTKWNGDFVRAAKVYPDRWVIEVKFPYSTFGAPKEGKAWLMGLNRCGPNRYESWTDATVHSPNSFRTLIME